MSVERFESLSDEALCILAEKMGLELPPGLERIFVTEEILSALEEDSEDRRALGSAPVHIEETKFSSRGFDEADACLDEAPCIQRRYDETLIRAIARDPAWAFAYWDLADAERLALRERDPAFAIFLRVTELKEGGSDRREYFDIPVSEDDLQWYINLPHPRSSYRIDLCSRLNGRNRVLAKSNPVLVPRQTLDAPIPATISRTLLVLSGLESFHIEPLATGNPQRILSGRDGE